MADERKPTKLMLTEKEREAMQTKAAKMGLPLATWIRIVALKAATDEA